MTPSPPARDTADASGARAIQPIGACTMGKRAPVCARTRFMRWAFSEFRSACQPLRIQPLRIQPLRGERGQIGVHRMCQPQVVAGVRAAVRGAQGGFKLEARHLG